MKLVCRFPGEWELYDLQAERTEINNIADKHPQKVKELDGLYQDWANRCFIYPWDKLREHRRQRRQQK
jgi:arylsulfatase